MIDIHCHLLYGIDDGAKTFESSAAMIKSAKADGICSIVATPHYSVRAVEKMRNRMAELQPGALACGIELHAGCEYLFADLGNRHQNLITLSSKGSFILIDFGSMFIPSVTKRLLYDFQLSGYRIIIAHPERLFSKKNLPVLEDLADCNVFFQLNAGSFRGDYGSGVRRFAKKLIEKGLCHYIASDAHSPKQYAGLLPQCRENIVKSFGREIETILFDENPGLLLKDIEPLSMLPAKKSRFFFQ